MNFCQFEAWADEKGDNLLIGPKKISQFWISEPLFSFSTTQLRKFRGKNWGKQDSWFCGSMSRINYLPWCGICGPCFVHNVRCNGWDVPYSSQIRTLCVLAHLHTESSHRAVFHSLDLTEHLHIVRQVRHGRCPVVVVEVLGKRRLCK